jgi:hypothetical protein
MIIISELPFSESDDWSSVFLRYFDKAGKLFTLERKIKNSK